jgi:hypothetical protein
LSTIVRAGIGIVLVAMLGGSPVLAETTQCRQIQARKDRNDCYERQKAAKQAPTKLGATKMDDAVDQMKLDDDRLTKRLQGICRGC